MTPNDISLLVNEQRLLIFLETAPQSNSYRQILLNDKEFFKISNSIGKIVEKNKDGIDIVQIEESVEEYTLPDLQSINP